MALPLEPLVPKVQWLNLRTKLEAGIVASVIGLLETTTEAISLVIRPPILDVKMMSLATILSELVAWTMTLVIEPSALVTEKVSSVIGFSSLVVGTMTLVINLGTYCWSGGSNHKTPGFGCLAHQIDGLAHQIDGLATRWGEGKSLCVFAECFTTILKVKIFYRGFYGQQKMFYKFLPHFTCKQILENGKKISKFFLLQNKQSVRKRW